MTADRYRAFAALHVPGDPLVLFNVWDVGSAKAVAATGAAAVATGSWSVAAAHGYDDGEALPLDVALTVARAIVDAVDVPVTIDFEGGYAVAPGDVAANASALAATGAIGCNFEDGVVGGQGLHEMPFQAERIAAVRAGAGPDFFINARTDIFLAAPATEHDDAKADAAIARAHAYAEAGASGFFVPGLVDLRLLERVCAGSPLPVNLMHFPGAPTKAEAAAVGVARISHGPGPYRIAMSAFEQAARAALAG